MTGQLKGGASCVQTFKCPRGTGSGTEGTNSCPAKESCLLPLDFPFENGQNGRLFMCFYHYFGDVEGKGQIVLCIVACLLDGTES